MLSENSCNRLGDAMGRLYSVGGKRRLGLREARKQAVRSQSRASTVNVFLIGVSSFVYSGVTTSACKVSQEDRISPQENIPTHQM